MSRFDKNGFYCNNINEDEHNLIKEVPVNIRVIINYDEQTESYSAVCPELPGCTSCGETIEEASENIKEAIQLYLEPDNRKISPTATVMQVAV